MGPAHGPVVRGPQDPQPRLRPRHPVNGLRGRRRVPSVSPLPDPAPPSTESGPRAPRRRWRPGGTRLLGRRGGSSGNGTPKPRPSAPPRAPGEAASHHSPLQIHLPPPKPQDHGPRHGLSEWTAQPCSGPRPQSRTARSRAGGAAEPGPPAGCLALELRPRPATPGLQRPSVAFSFDVTTRTHEEVTRCREGAAQLLPPSVP